MSPGLEEIWRQISPYLDEALALDASAQQLWLSELEKREPTIAARIRAELLELSQLQKDSFLSSPEESSPATGLAGQRFGSYTLEQMIGHGGMGSVWLAHRSDGRFEGQAAVKLLNTALLGQPAELRFVREGSVLAKLNHPHIAHLLDAGVAAGSQPYLVLEYVSGERIDRYCDSHALTLGQRIVLFLDVLAAVAHAHSNLIVHRDLKPSNIFVTEDGSVKLLDFGIAALLSSGTDDITHLTGLGAAALTPGYAAPEQWQGGAVTTATDVFALGVVLFELLAGRHPASQAREAGQLMRWTLEADPPRLSECVSDPRQRRLLRGDLDNIVALAMRHNPAERYSTVELFAQDLRHYLAHEPVSARAPSFAYLGAKFVRRNLLPVAIASAVSIALIVTGGLAVLQMLEAQHQRQAAEQQDARAGAVDDYLGLILADAGVSGKPFTTEELLEKAAQSIVAVYGSADNRLAIEQTIEIGNIYANFQQHSKALELLEPAHARALKAGYRDLARESACALGRIYYDVGKAKEAEALIKPALSELRRQAPHSNILATCLRSQAHLDQLNEDFAAALANATEADALVRKNLAYAPLRQVPARVDLAIADRAAGNLKAADARYRETLQLLKSAGYERSQTGGAVLQAWSMVRSDAGDLRGAAERSKAAVDIASTERPDGTPNQVIALTYARHLLYLNRLDEAQRYFAQGRVSAVSQGDSYMEATSLVGLAAVKREQGDTVGMTAALREAVDFITPRFPPEDRPRKDLVVETARQYLAQGAYAAADEELERGFTQNGLGKKTTLAAAFGLDALAEAELGLGRLKEAAAHAQQARVAFEPFALPGEPSFWTGYGLVVQAKVAAAARDGSAERLAKEALAQLLPTVGSDHPLALRAQKLAAGLPGQGY